MRIVVDTNVVISGVFFGGVPQRILEAVVTQEVTACATPEIVEEYQRVVEEMIDRRLGHIHRDVLMPFITELALYSPHTKISVCRDPDDDKFLACALDSSSYYIVSGDKDLLDMKHYQGVTIVTAADFCKRFLSDTDRWA